jgi:hypothetical protein
MGLAMIFMHALIAYYEIYWQISRSRPQNEYFTIHKKQICMYSFVH